jgi:undecaprenyl-diphosphatase
MRLIEAIILGLTQGLTEFLPISSSGHLILIPWLFEWEEPGLAFDAALHLGTLVAVFAYFWRELLAVALAAPRAMRAPSRYLAPPAEGDAEADWSARLALLLVIGSIPGGIAGLLFQNTIDGFFHGGEHQELAIALVATLLIAFAVLLAMVERIARHRRDMRSVTAADSLAIGLAQMLALIPGVSRSGVTLTAGLWRDLKRADAARFSFLLGTPLVFLASLKGLVDLLREGAGGVGTTPIVVGILVSAVSGFAAIWFLLRLLQRASTRAFVVYRIAVGVGVLVMLASGVR